MRTIPVLCATTVALAVLASAEARAAGDAARGRRLSIEHCARCHVIGKYNRHGGLGSTPSFGGLKLLPHYKHRILTFYERPPHLAFAHVAGHRHLKERIGYTATFTITPGGVRDILAYVETLTPPRALARRASAQPRHVDKKSELATARMRAYIQSLREHARAQDKKSAAGTSSAAGAAAAAPHSE